MPEMIIRRTQERVGNRYLGASSQVYVFSKRKNTFVFTSLWNFQVSGRKPVPQEVEEMNGNAVTLAAITPYGRHDDPVEQINLKHWGVK